MTPSRLHIVPLIAALAAALCLAACNKPGATGGTAAGLGLSEDGYGMGNPNAKVTVIEFASLTCPHCAHWEETVWPAFKAKYVDTGKIHYVFREFLIHEQIDAAGALLTRCVSADKYFPTVQAIFRSQSQMEAGDVRGALQRVAQAEGMTDQQFDACLRNDDALKTVGARQQKIQDTYHVDQTPTFLVNGKALDVNGDYTMEKLSAAIDPLLAKP